jgi:hypothetical protein
VPKVVSLQRPSMVARGGSIHDDGHPSGVASSRNRPTARSAPSASSAMSTPIVLVSPSK